MHDGEKANFQGELFDRSCSDLIKKLGYVEKSSGTKFGIDTIAEPHKSIDETIISKPLFSPDGLTAFEFTSSYNIGDADITELKNKIDKINKKKNAISGGVLIVDVRISDNLYASGIKNGIYIWDVRDATFLSTKILIYRIWSSFGTVIEKKIDNNVSYLWVLEKNSETDFYKAKVALFFHNPINEITSEELENSIKKLTEIIIQDGIKIGFLPIQIEIEIHSRSFLRKDAIKKYEEILKKFSTEEKIAYTLKYILTYYISPWIGMINLK